MEFTTSIAIIGAGPAGALAALLLARAGACVTLIEQHIFPRDKVCGECISFLGWNILHRAGLTTPLLAAGAIPLTRAALHAPNGRSVWLDLPSPMHTLSRRTLDTLLLDLARSAGATLLQPVRCEKLTPNHTLLFRHLSTNTLTELHPSLILLADGKSSLLPPRPPATADLALKAHFSHLDAPRNAVELFGLPDHYLGLAPIENGLWNLACSIPRALLAETPNPDELFFHRILPHNPTLKRYFRRAERKSDWLTSPLPRFPVRTDWPPNIIPLGNAAAALEPIGGEGMGLALASAQVAANAILQAIKTNTPISIKSLMREDQKLWRFRRLACRFAADWVSRPHLCALAVELLTASHSLSTLLLASLGKTDEPGRPAIASPPAPG